jgi:hypothetical protein
MRITKKKSHKKKLLIASATGALIIVAVAGYVLYGQIAKNDGVTTGVGVESEEEIINLDPPTEQELADAEEHKKKVAEQQKRESEPQPQEDGKKQVTPTISAYPQSTSSDVTVRSYVSGIIENGGKCTLTLEKSGQKVTESRSGVSDAQHTSCGAITISRSSLSAGTWQATVSYSSKVASGKSEVVEIVVN